MERKSYRKQIQTALKSFPIVALLGARQIGKTTLSRLFTSNYRFDLENPTYLAQLENPKIVLEKLKGLVVIDEIQRKPDLFPLLRFLVDRPKNNMKILILGSASRDLIRQSSESLAGRIFYKTIFGFDLTEIKDPSSEWERLWLRGAFPISFLSKSDSNSFAWREQYITTFLERDIPQLGIRVPAATLRRFWIMLSHYHGQLVNYSELGKSLGISESTVKSYIDILVGTFMILRIQPWYENLGKRLTKQSKIYIQESGIFHTLQSIETKRNLDTHPKLGASFEGFVIQQVISISNLAPENFFFYRTYQGTELDLFWMKKGKRYGLGIKYSDAPTITKSMMIAMQDLKLHRLFVVYPGKDAYPLTNRIMVLPIDQIAKLFTF
jgi:predicted AAA+ superfamily ATPase